jgi:hypothetical protein
MKSPDRFLIAIVIGIFLLMAIGLGVAFLQEGPTYRTEDSPENIVHNYLLALHLRDYDRAYGYVSPTLIHYPTIGEFRETTRREFWRYYGDSQQSMGIEILNTEEMTAGVTVEAQVNFYDGGSSFPWWFDRGWTRSDNLAVDVEQGEDGVWKITKSTEYWDSCWHSASICD